MDDRNFHQKSKFSSMIEIFIKKQNFCQKSKFLSIIKIFGNNQNFCQKSKFCSKIENLVENRFRKNPVS